MKIALLLLFLIPNDFTRCFIVSQNPKRFKPLFLSTEEFLKIIPKNFPLEESIEYFKKLSDMEKKYEILRIERQNAYEIQQREKEITSLHQKLIVANMACTSRGIFEYVLKAANPNPYIFDARRVRAHVVKGM